MSRLIQLNSIIEGRVDCSNNIVTMAGIKIKKVDISSNYTITNKDYLIYVDTANASSNITITLPIIDASTNNQIFNIVDGTGNASSKNIILSRQSTNTIMGNTSYTINNDYTSITLYAHPNGKYSII